MKTVWMYGPSISKPDTLVEREIPEADVQAYRAAGYAEGRLPKAEKKSEAPAPAPTASAPPATSAKTKAKTKG